MDNFLYQIGGELQLLTAALGDTVVISVKKLMTVPSARGTEGIGIRAFTLGKQSKLHRKCVKETTLY